MILFQLATTYFITICRNCCLKQKKYSYFEWINERIEPISEDELNMINTLINLLIELNKHQQEYDDWIKIIVLHRLN